MVTHLFTRVAFASGESDYAPGGGLPIEAARAWAQDHMQRIRRRGLAIGPLTFEVFDPIGREWRDDGAWVHSPEVAERTRLVEALYAGIGTPLR